MDVWIAGWTVGLMGIEGWSKKVPDTPFSSHVCALCTVVPPPPPTTWSEPEEGGHGSRDVSFSVHFWDYVGYFLNWIIIFFRGGGNGGVTKLPSLGTIQIGIFIYSTYIFS